VRHRTGRGLLLGDNELGKLGDGTASSSVPVAVDTRGVLAGKTLTLITTGGEHTCALDSTGAAYCWGDSSYGEVGDGKSLPSSGSSVRLPWTPAARLPARPRPDRRRRRS
jgi:alpha-tubulin suppressor-like RCC1 family protein